MSVLDVRRGNFVSRIAQVFATYEKRLKKKKNECREGDEREGDEREPTKGRR